MRWFSISRKDGSKVAAFCTHSVAEVFDKGQRRYMAWKFTGRQAGEAQWLGTFETDSAALAAVERDARGRESEAQEEAA